MHESGSEYGWRSVGWADGTLTEMRTPFLLDRVIDHFAYGRLAPKIGSAIRNDGNYRVWIAFVGGH